MAVRTAPLGDINGDGIGDIAVGSLYDEDGNYQAGAIWILFLNTDGTVKAHQKISQLEGNFNVSLPQLASFGCSIDLLGDLDKDGVNDIIVGAYRDNTTYGSKTGAAYILFLNVDGTVKNYKKIGNNISFDLGSEDYFASAISVLEDYDLNGLPDLAMSAHRNDDGGIDNGAIYLLSINSDGSIKSNHKINSSDVPGIGTDDHFGSAIIGITDINNDGADDLLVGSPGDDGGRGAFHILYMNNDYSVISSVKYSSNDYNQLDLNMGDHFASNIEFINYDDTQPRLKILVSSISGDDVILNTGVVYEIDLSVPSPISAGDDIKTCDGSSVTMNAQPIPFGTWTLLKGYGEIINPNNPDTEIKNLHKGLNSFIWQNNTCSFDKDTVDILITDNISANAGYDQFLCDSTNTILNAFLLESTLGNWTIIKGTGHLENINDPKSMISDLNSDVTQLVWHISNYSCEVKPDTVNITLEKKRDGLIKAGDDISKKCDTQQIVLDGQLSDDKNNYYWEVIKGEANISDSSILNPILTDLSDNIELRLNLKGNICPIIDSDTVMIQTPEIANVNIPNIFTPNGDKFNQSFIIDDQLVGSQLKIFNREKLVFQDGNYRNDWSGNYLDNSTGILLMPKNILGILNISLRSDIFI